VHARWWAQVFVLVGLVWPTVALSQAPVLQSPVRCAMQDVCWVVQYFDHDAGPLAADYLGGSRSYDDHTGTDIGLVNYAAMAAGVPVVAAADGVVGGVRDGMQDWGHQTLDQEAVQGRKCGNGVRVDHGNGWQTIYCHLRQGSVTVASGEQVQAGQVLGMIGQSGLAAFPHVEFGVLHDGDQVDPFLLEDGSSLWSSAAVGQLSYSPMDIYHAGFADRAPDWAAVQAGDYANREFGVDADALVVWVEMFSVKEGDDVSFKIVAPDGNVLLDHSESVQKTQSRIFRFVGKKRPGDAWSAGTYQADISITRSENGHTIARERTISATVQ